MMIYISNIPTTVNDKELLDLFSPFGAVKTAKISYDSFTEKSRGFGFVEMEDDASAEKAIADLNNSNFENHTINVTEAPPKLVQKGSYKVGTGVTNIYRFKKS